MDNYRANHVRSSEFTRAPSGRAEEQGSGGAGEQGSRGAEGTIDALLARCVDGDGSAHPSLSSFVIGHFWLIAEETIIQ
jgi:hypothetical protein